MIVRTGLSANLSLNIRNVRSEKKEVRLRNGGFQRGDILEVDSAVRTKNAYRGL